MSEGPQPEVSIITKVHKAVDLETHLRQLRFPDDEITVLELRDYVPSTGKYGRGYWVSMDSVHALSEAFADYEVS